MIDSHDLDCVSLSCCLDQFSLSTNDYHKHFLSLINIPRCAVSVVLSVEFLGFLRSSQSEIDGFAKTSFVVSNLLADRLEVLFAERVELADTLLDCWDLSINWILQNHKGHCIVSYCLHQLNIAVYKALSWGKQNECQSKLPILTRSYWEQMFLEFECVMLEAHPCELKTCT